MSEKPPTKEEWQKWRRETDSTLTEIAQKLNKKLQDSPGEREKPENKHLHTLKEQIDCPDCYPDLRKKVYDKEFKNADAQCVGCGLLAKKDEAEKEEWECPNCGSREAEARD